MQDRIVRLARLYAPPKKINLEPDFCDFEQFDEAARSIVSEWKERRAEGSVPFNLRAVPWLTRYAYEVLERVISTGGIEIIDYRNRKFKRYAQGVPDGINVFQKGLMSIFAHDHRSISVQQRERIGKEMFLAFRHYVPAEFVLGFLTHLPARDTVAGMLDRNEVEATYLDWVVRHRAAGDPGDFYRCEYPPHVDAAVERLKASAAASELDPWEEDDLD